MADCQGFEIDATKKVSLIHCQPPPHKYVWCFKTPKEPNCGMQEHFHLTTRNMKKKTRYKIKIRNIYK